MNIYLYQDGRQMGPFTEEQVRQLRREAGVDAQALVWREGMSGWQPIAEFASTAPPAAIPPVAQPARSSLGLISFLMSLVTLVGWLVLLTVAGLAHNAGTATQSFNVFVGLLVMIGLTINFAGMVVGVVGAFKSRWNIFAILGASLHGFIMVALVALVLIGLAAGHAKSM